MNEARVNTEPLVEFLATVEILSAFNHDELQELAMQAEIEFYNFGEPVFKAKDPARGLYIVRSGMVRIFTEDHGKEISMGVRKVGEAISEMAALKRVQQEASARASAKTELVLIPHESIAEILQRNREAEKFVKNYVAVSTAGGFVTKLFDLGRKIDKSELEKLIGSVGVKRVKAGEPILEQDGCNDTRLYIVRQGEVKIVQREKDEEFPIATLGQGEVFGEKACLQKGAQPASAIAETDVVLLVLPQETVHFILERNPKLKAVFEERIHFAELELERQKQLAERRRKPALLDLWSKPRLGERVIKRFPLVEQAEEADCGAACLAMICKHHGLSITLGKLRELANVTTEGATLESLARVGETLGFTTRGVRCTYQSMQGFELPFIAHWEGYHYVVVYGLSKHHVWVADPALGFKKMTAAEFEKGWTGTCLLFTPGADMAQLAAKQSAWVRFVSYLRPYKKFLAHLVMATLIIEVLSVFPPVIIQNILDRVVVHQSVQLLHVLMAGLILTHLFTQLTSTLRAFLSNFMIRSLDFTMMSQFFKHALSLPIAFFAKRRTGDIFARFQENTTIRAFLTESTISTILNVLMIFIYFIVLFLYNVKMTLLLIALVIPMGVLTVFITPIIKNYARRNFEASTDAEAVLMETLAGAETVKAVGIERPMRLRWEKKYAKALDVQYRSQRFDIFVGLGSQLLNAATTVVILWTGANLVLDQELTIGQLIAFNMLMGSVMAPLLGLIGLWDELHEVGIAMERLGDVLDLEPEQKPENLSTRIILPSLRGDIRFENVYFRYGGSETPYVLQNIGFRVKAGEMVAIVGHSGSGKSTLAKLMVGFYPPTEGKIYVDGYDLELIDKEYYRPQIGYVMQNNLLFSGTIAENVALGDENPDRRRIIEVAQIADAHSFIRNMPLGYEQPVGERGVGLSGGQMQRLCIARALYHNPRLLILDEATSALDTQSEGNILKNLEEIIEGRTVVVIAHRLSTVMNASKILVLYEGAIVEDGRHEELLERKGMYYQLVQKQISKGR